MWPFSSKHRNLKLGIDIGTATVKVVALSRGSKDGQFILENYGTVMSPWSLQNPNSPGQESPRLPDGEVIEMVKAVLAEMKAPYKAEAVFSIPVYSSFITEITLPPMSLSELNTAISDQAKQYVPISLSEVELDWQVISKQESPKAAPAVKAEGQEEAAEKLSPDSAKLAESEGLNVLLAAVPRETVQRSEYLAKEIGVKLTALEIETFGLVRSVVGRQRGAVCLVDMGARNTNITIVVDGFIRLNRNIDVGGDELTRVIAQSMGLTVRRAEEMKRLQGLKAEGGEHEIVAIMHPVLDKILVEVERVVNAYGTRHHQELSEVILIGGSAQLNGVVEYLSEKLRIPHRLGDPWQNVSYPPEMKPILTELAPTFATAIGLAMR